MSKEHFERVLNKLTEHGVLQRGKTADLVDKSLNALELSVTGTLPIARGSTRTSDARFVIAVVLELPDAKPDSAREGDEASIKTMGQLAELSEYIRLKKQDERRGA